MPPEMRGCFFALGGRVELREDRYAIQDVRSLRDPGRHVTIAITPGGYLAGPWSTGVAGRLRTRFGTGWHATKIADRGAVLHSIRHGVRRWIRTLTKIRVGFPRMAA
jgi:hypothetical protein